MSNGMTPVLVGAAVAAIFLVVSCPAKPKETSSRPITPQVRYVPVPVPQQGPSYQQAPQQQHILVTCPKCKGTGYKPGAYIESDMDRCPYCAGKGVIRAGQGNQGGFGVW